MELPQLMEAFWRDGFVKLGQICSQEELESLNKRLDDIMLGHIQYPNLLMQLDPFATANVQGENENDIYKQTNTEVNGQTAGFKGASLAYRKVGEAQAGLECDDLFLKLMQKDLFKNICGEVFGSVPISVYRSMVMSKPAGTLGGGAPLPWHQDGGEWWALDRDPLCFVWVALSPATAENGAVQVCKGSHLKGLLSKRGHTLREADIESLISAHPENVIDVELAPGEAFLCHNFTVHRSGSNKTDSARRGFSFNYADGRTKVLNPKPEGSGPIGVAGEGFPIIFP